MGVNRSINPWNSSLPEPDLVPQYRGNWGSAAFQLADVVTYNSGLFIATSDTLASDIPGNSNKWELIVNGISLTDTINKTIGNVQAQMQVTTDNLKAGTVNPVTASRLFDNYSSLNVINTNEHPTIPYNPFTRFKLSNGKDAYRNLATNSVVYVEQGGLQLAQGNETEAQLNAMADANSKLIMLAANLLSPATTSHLIDRVSTERLGGTVQLPAGIIPVTPTLKWRSYVRFNGAGIRSTILVPYGGTSDSWVFDDEGLMQTHAQGNYNRMVDLGLENLTISPDQQFASAPKRAWAGNGIKVGLGGGRTDLRNVAVFGLGGTGFRTEAQDHIIDNCTFNGCGINIDVGSNQYGVANALKFSNCRSEGLGVLLRIAGGQYSEPHNNIFTNCKFEQVSSNTITESVVQLGAQIGTIFSGCTFIPGSPTPMIRFGRKYLVAANAALENGNCAGPIFDSISVLTGTTGTYKLIKSGDEAYSQAVIGSGNITGLAAYGIDGYIYVADGVALNACSTPIAAITPGTPVGKWIVSSPVGGNSIVEQGSGGISIPESPLISGKNYTNTTSRFVTIYQRMTLPANNAALAKCEVFVGPAYNNPTIIISETYQDANTSTARSVTLMWRVPPGWSYKISATDNITLGAAQAIGE